MLLLVFLAVANAESPAGEPPPAVCAHVRPPPIELVEPVGGEASLAGGEAGGFLPTGNLEPGKTRACALVHHSAIKWKLYRRKPEVAGAAPVRDVWCVLRVDLDSAGTPTAAEPRSCPEAFLSAARASVLEARAYRYRVDGVAIPVRVDVNVVFKAPPPADEPPAQPSPG